MLKNVWKWLVLALPLFAFQCDEEPGSMFEYNDFKVKVSSSASFSINEIIWLEGQVSSRVYDLASGDSVFTDSPMPDVFSIYRLIEPTELANCKDALDKFELVYEFGEYSFLPVCENATVQALPKLDDLELFYVYRLGLKPKQAGDFVISLQSGTLQNLVRNEFIIEAYPIPNRPNEIGFDNCGNLSWRYLDESEREFYFSVTP